MSKLLLRSICLLALSHGALLTAQETATEARWQTVRDAILDAIADRQMPGASVAVVERGKMVWAEGFGLADAEDETPATADTVYSLGWASELLTATGLMVLVDRGDIDLDTPANDLLEDAAVRSYDSPAGEITVVALARHEAALPEHWNELGPNRQQPSLDETIRRYAFASSAPGDPFLRRDAGYAVLARIMEHAAERPWQQLLREEVFAPLGMVRTVAELAPGQIAAVRYRLRGGAFEALPPGRFENPAATAAYSSVLDLARLLIVHLAGGETDGGRLFHARWARQMRTGDGLVALGWRLLPFTSPERVVQSSRMPGTAVKMAGFPESGLGYVLLANAATAPLDEIEAPILQALDVASEAEEVVVGIGGTPPRAARGTWSGTWWLPQGPAPVQLEVPRSGHPILRLRDQVLTRARNTARFGTNYRVAFETDRPLAVADDRELRSWRIELHLAEDETMAGTAWAVGADYCLPHAISPRQ